MLKKYINYNKKKLNDDNITINDENVIKFILCFICFQMCHEETIIGGVKLLYSINNMLEEIPNIFIVKYNTLFSNDKKSRGFSNELIDTFPEIKNIEKLFKYLNDYQLITIVLKRLEEIKILESGTEYNSSNI